jgi:hypothetical protein
MDIYAEAETILLARMAKYLAAGLESPDWLGQKILQLQLLRRQAEGLVAKLGNRAAAQVAVDLARAYNMGGAQAASDLAALLKVGVEQTAGPIQTIPSVELLVAETMSNLSSANDRILRSVEDAYRSIVSETMAQTLTGTVTRRQAAQAALDRFAQKGITGFVDKRGRGWDLGSYVEMAMRTGTHRAMVKGHMDRLQAYGQDLVIISDAPGECPLCRPWEGKVLSISGTSAKYPSLQSAKDAGLFHCNCRHSSSLYQEGITPPLKGKTEDPVRYEASQKQRYLERQVRKQKRLLAAALDDGARRKADARVKGYQAKLREHVKTYDLPRLYYREQAGKAR